jgi:cytochrome P450
VNWEERLYLTAHPFAYPLLREVARRGPIVRVPRVGVVVNDAALAREVLMDGETFRKDGPGSPGDLWTPVLGPSVLLNMEGDAHRALRRRLTDLFVPSYTEALCARVLAEPLARLTGRLGRGATIDLVDAARVMAGTVIGEVIGLEGGTEAVYRDLFEQGGVLGDAELDPLGDIAAKSYLAGDESTVMGRMRALGLSEDEARGAAGAFFLTGTETVATLLPRLVALLCDHGQLLRVAEDTALLDRAIEEAMRVTTPTPVMLRGVHRPATVGGVGVRPGERVLIATHTCCRAYGPFDLDRPHPPELRRLWFGAGPHFCIGYPLAMAQIRLVARALLRAAPFTITRRAAARNVLIPTYRHLFVRAGEAP